MKKHLMGMNKLVLATFVSAFSSSSFGMHVVNNFKGLSEVQIQQLLAEKQEQLRSAAERGQSDIVEQLVPLMGIDVNAPDKDGNTALHKAVERRHIKIVGLLLSHGSRLDIANREGLTPVAIAQKLLEIGESRDIQIYNRLVGAQNNAADVAKPLPSEEMGLAAQKTYVRPSSEERKKADSDDDNALSDDSDDENAPCVHGWPHQIKCVICGERFRR